MWGCANDLLEVKDWWVSISMLRSNWIKTTETCVSIQKCVDFKIPFFQEWHKEHVATIKATNFLFLSSPMSNGRLKEPSTFNSSSSHPLEGTHTLWQTRILLLRKNGLNQSSIPKYSTFSLSLSLSHSNPSPPELSQVGRPLFRFPNCSQNPASRGRSASDRGQWEGTETARSF